MLYWVWHAALTSAKSSAPISRWCTRYSPKPPPTPFKLIRAAYEKLNTAEAKTETDLFLFQPPPPWEPANVVVNWNWISTRKTSGRCCNLW